jgi:hypothetical protein
MHGKHHLVGVPVGEQIGRHRDEERDDHSALAPDDIADRQEQPGERRQQQRRSHVVHRPSLVASLQRHIAPAYMICANRRCNA